MPCRLMTHLHITRAQHFLRPRLQDAAPLDIALLRMRKERCLESCQALLKVLAADVALAVLCLKHAYSLLQVLELCLCKVRGGIVNCLTAIVGIEDPSGNGTEE